MSIEAKATRLLTVADLAERWSCDESTVLEHVRLDGLPFIPVGRRPAHRSRPGPKSYRFRIADVEAWEERRRMSWGVPESAIEPLPVPPPGKAPALPGVPGWDGKLRGGKRVQMKK